MYPNDGGKPSMSSRLKEFFSPKRVFSLRNIIIMGLMAAIAAVLSVFRLDITPTFRAISFTYLPGAMVALLFGPWAALVYGFVADTVQFLARPQGPYFPGFAISEMVGCFIYACFLYKRPVTYLRALLARAVVVVVVILGLNYLWNYMMMGQAAGSYFTGVRLINNLVQLPFHALLITFIGKQMRKLNIR